MTRSQSIAAIMMFALGLAFVPAAMANPRSDACVALGKARIALYSMLSAKTKSEQDSLKDKVQAASKELDSVLVELRRLTFVGASSGGYIRRNRPCHGEKRKIALPESPSRLQSWNA
jgi:hypothetical protein